MTEEIEELQQVMAECVQEAIETLGQDVVIKALLDFSGKLEP